MQDDQHELEPGVHLLLGRRDVGGEHNVVGLDLLGHGLVEAADLVALVGAPGHEPLALLALLARVHALGGQVGDGRGGTGSCNERHTDGMEKAFAAVPHATLTSTASSIGFQSRAG